MSTKALYAVMLALLLPLVSYFIVKHYSESAIVMPAHYFYDTIVNRVKNGKQYSDTTWHRLPDFSLTNQVGQKVSWKDLRTKDSSTKIVVADFFFTHCPTICIPMARNMKRLQQSINNSQKVGDTIQDFIQFLSFSIDPERDSVAQLKKWANRFQIDPEHWWLLTGDKKFIYDLAWKEMRIPVQDGLGVDDSFSHTDHFVLVDRNRNIRGFYHGLDSSSLSKLSNDIILLMLEKDPRKKSFLEGNLQMIIITLAIAVVGVGLFLFLFRKKTF